MTISAEDLVSMSLGTLRKVGSTKQESRAYFLAKRAGFCNDDNSVNLQKLENALRDGSVWRIRWVGRSMITIWAEWVTGERDLPDTSGVGRLQMYSATTEQNNPTKAMIDFQKANNDQP